MPSDSARPRFCRARERRRERDCQLKQDVETLWKEKWSQIPPRHFSYVCGFPHEFFTWLRVRTMQPRKLGFCNSPSCYWLFFPLFWARYIRLRLPFFCIYRTRGNAKMLDVWRRRSPSTISETAPRLIEPVEPLYIQRTRGPKKIFYTEEFYAGSSAIHSWIWHLQIFLPIGCR
jgi:hypothetical protein